MVRLFIFSFVKEELLLDTDDCSGRRLTPAGLAGRGDPADANKHSRRLPDRPLVRCRLQRKSTL